MSKQIKALIGHESGRHPLGKDTLQNLKEVLLNYDTLFTKLQNDNPESIDLTASIIDSYNAMVEYLGYEPCEK